MKKVASELVIFLSLIISVSSYANSDFDACFRDLCDDEIYDSLSVERLNAAAVSLNSTVEDKFGTQIKKLLSDLQPYYKEEIQDPNFFEKNHNRCIGVISKVAATLPTREQLYLFKQENPLKAYTLLVSNWLGVDSAKAIKSVLFEKTKLNFPLSQESLYTEIHQRLSEVVSGGDELRKDFSGPYLCTPTKGQLFSTPALNGMWQLGSTRDNINIPDDEATIYQKKFLGKTIEIKADMNISSYTIKSKDYFVFFHEISHIINSMERLGLLSESSVTKLRKARECTFRNRISPDQNVPYSLDSQQLYDATFENFPDVLAAFIFKQTGKKGTPRLFCEMLTAQRPKTTSPSVDVGSANRNHGSTLFRTLLVHAQVNGQIPKSCNQYLKANQSDLEFKDCFPVLK